MDSNENTSGGALARRSPRAQLGRPSQHDARASAALEAAAEVLNRDGLSKASLASVAKALRISKSALYYYFKNKEELVYKCYLKTCHKSLGCVIKAASFPGNGCEQLRQYLILQLNAPATAFVSDINFLNSDHQREIRTLARQHDGYLQKILATGQNDHSLASASCELVNFAIVGTINWMHIWEPLQKGAGQRSEVAAAFVDLFLFGLRPRGSSGAGPQIAPVELDKQELFSESVFDREYLAAQRRESILRAATEFFNRTGFDNCSLAEIVESLNVTAGALYHYVDSKEELLFECYQRSLDLTEEVLNRIAAEPGSGLQKLLRFVASIIELNAGPHRPLASYFRLKSLTVTHQKEIRSRDRRMTHKFNFLKLGVEDGSIRTEVDPALAKLALVGALNWIPKWYSRSGRATPAEVRHAFCTLFSDGLVPRS
jgi:AcrR family transcriptional regulator